MFKQEFKPSFLGGGLCIPRPRSPSKIGNTLITSTYTYDMHSYMKEYMEMDVQ